jgi:hypothetical protein
VSCIIVKLINLLRTYAQKQPIGVFSPETKPENTNQ